MNKYKEIISKLGAYLKSLGFVKKGDTYYLSNQESWQLINIQRSQQKSLDGNIRFTINIGICSKSIWKFLEGSTDVLPNIDECHWRKRIGFLLPIKEDYWWKVDNNTSVEELLVELQDVIDHHVAPVITKYSDDASLECMWLKNISEGITELEKYIFLTTLLKIKGRENLSAIASEMKAFAKGRSFEISALEHLKMLGEH